MTRLLSMVDADPPKAGRVTSRDECEGDHVTGDVLDRRTSCAGILEKGNERALVEELDVVRIVVGFGRDRRDAESSCDPDRFTYRTRGIGHVLEHFEQRDTVEERVSEGEGGRIHFGSGEARDPAPTDRG